MESSADDMGTLEPPTSYEPPGLLDLGTLQTLTQGTILQEGSDNIFLTGFTIPPTS